MQVRGLALLGLLLGAEGTLIVRRQADDDALDLNRRQATATDSVDVSSAVESAVESASDVVSSAVDPVVSSTDVEVITATSTTPDDDTVTSESASAEVTTSSDSGSSDSDSTITRTVTVTDADADTITQKTTVQRTVTSTIVVTSTKFETETVTSSGETATSTVYETSTTWANEKRAINLAPRTVDNHGIAIVDAKPTDTPKLSDAEQQDLRHFLIGRNDLVKRATVTKLVTVTVGSDAGKTVVNSVTQTVISTTSKATVVTKTVTETEAAGASTTITKTSTLVITSTRVTTGVVVTATVAPTGSYGTAGTGGSDSSSSDSSSSSSSSGLSTGAKAGIGAGCGVVGLAVIGIILWCCLKKRNKPSKSEIDDMFGSSEVPVGGVRGNGTSPHMAQTSPGMDSALAGGRLSAKNSTAEGYRGTALGDGRAGYAKPNNYGSSYNAVSPETQYSRTATMNTAGREELLADHHARGDLVSPATTTTTAAELGNDGGGARWIKSDAAEIDGTQMSSARGSSPAEHVYEMPAQPYR
ncbi:hypothetical protein AK830_g8129 [Neonectria ditissima]|uniref:Mid2 domain-containing protein n=1 Tax=Neonectria ditissima TaxID=78410 RepID=A0A0P7AKX5_9HYPO|nr:hypothetical protein AK830_g8129 [Neonectria ditissima]